MRITAQSGAIYGVLISLLLACSAEVGAEEPAAKPGDEQIEAYLKQETAKLSDRVLDGAKTREEWETRRPRLRQEYFDMLGLWPLPEKTPLNATVTGTVETRRRRHREAALPEPAGPVRHRQPVSAEEEQRASCRRSSTSAATPTRAATATRPPFRITACGSRPTATSA